jgi:hypothetical protein
VPASKSASKPSPTLHVPDALPRDGRARLTENGRGEARWRKKKALAIIFAGGATPPTASFRS